MADQVNVMFVGRNSQERTDLELGDGTHLRLRSGDIIALTDEQATWLLSQRPYKYWFHETEAEPRRAVAGTDVVHAADAPITP